MTTTLESVAILGKVVLLQSHVKLDVSRTRQRRYWSPRTQRGAVRRHSQCQTCRVWAVPFLDEAIRGQKGNSGITLETTWRRFWPIGAEELGRKWITVQTDRSGQPPGLVSWQRSSPLDQGSPELQAAPRFFLLLQDNSYVPENKKENATAEVVCFSKMAGWSLATRGRSSF